MASIISKWKTFRTIRTPPTAGHLANLSNRGRAALVSEKTKNPMATLTELQCYSVESRRITNQACMVEGLDESNSSVKGT